MYEILSKQIQVKYRDDYWVPIEAGIYLANVRGEVIDDV